MIWVWLIGLLKAMQRFFTPPKPGDIAKVDVNARCPVCGHRDGFVTAIDAMSGMTQTIACLHTCKVCGARFFEQSVAKISFSNVACSKDAPMDNAMLRRAMTARGEEITRLKEANQGF